MDWDKYWKNFGIVAIILLPFYVLWLIIRTIFRIIFQNKSPWQFCQGLMFFTSPFMKEVNKMKYCGIYWYQKTEEVWYQKLKCDTKACFIDKSSQKPNKFIRYRRGCWRQKIGVFYRPLSFFFTHSLMKWILSGEHRPRLKYTRDEQNNLRSDCY